ncbi:MAG: hypothetical protein NT025_00075 [bacterium]|nr:hypothetical protein [bacterium]
MTHLISDDQQSTAKKPWWGRHGRLLIVALFAVIAIVVLKMLNEPVEPRLAPEPPSATIPKKKDYSGEVNRLVQQAATEDQTALQQFQHSLSMALVTYESESAKAAETAAVYASTFTSIRRIIGYMAYDQIKSTETAGAYLNALISPPLKIPVDGVVLEVNAATAALEYDLQKISVQLAVDLAALGPGPAPLPKTFTSSQAVKQDFERTLKNLGINATAVGVSLAMDVYAILDAKIIQRLVNAVVSIAATLFEKQLSKAIVVMMGPLADGPLPIGDAIAILFAAWTAYDIYHLQPAFHENVKTASENQLREIGAEVSRQASENASRRLASYKSVQSRIGAESLKTLSN